MGGSISRTLSALFMQMRSAVSALPDRGSTECAACLGLQLGLRLGLGLELGLGVELELGVEVGLGAIARWYAG
jgi:hypothetical protein